MCESCHVWMSHVTYEWVMSCMNESCHTWIGHVWYRYMNDSNCTGGSHHVGISYVCDMTHSQVAGLIYPFSNKKKVARQHTKKISGLFIYDMTHLCVTCMCDMTHLYVTWRIHVWHDSSTCDMNYSCATWLINVGHRNPSLRGGFLAGWLDLWVGGL